MSGSLGVVVNLLLLAGVIAGIVYTVKSKRENLRSRYVPPAFGRVDAPACDDIIAVRKINRELSHEAPIISPLRREDQEMIEPLKKSITTECKSTSIMMFLLAKEDRLLSGYELLQTLLAAGLRFGEGHLFHRHQYINGQGPVLCSVAAATASGMFDLQNIGAFSVHGLCIFMETSGNSSIDGERFGIMLETARQLSEDLDTYLLDEHRKQVTSKTIARYYNQLGVEAPEALAVV
jgi:cell division protein ZipA